MIALGRYGGLGAVLLARRARFVARLPLSDEGVLRRPPLRGAAGGGRRLQRSRVGADDGRCASSRPCPRRATLVLTPLASALSCRRERPGSSRISFRPPWPAPRARSLLRPGSCGRGPRRGDGRGRAAGRRAVPGVGAWPAWVATSLVPSSPSATCSGRQRGLNPMMPPGGCVVAELVDARTDGSPACSASSPAGRKASASYWAGAPRRPLSPRRRSRSRPGRIRSPRTSIGRRGSAPR